MSEMKHETETREGKHDSGIRLVIPFFVVLAVLTVVSFLIPLRPTVSYSEKRELAKFPEFSLEALTSGSYFDDITTWFSDTFPGRESWVRLSQYTSDFHGYSEITIEGSLEPQSQEIVIAVETEPAEETVQGKEVTETESEQTEAATEPQETTWGGVDAGEDAEISLGTAIQIGDSAFNQLGFSKSESDRYAKNLSALAELVKDKGARVISCPAPTSIGIMVEKQYLEKLNCAPQDEMLEYMHSNMSEDVIGVDTVTALLEHNDEYIYFRTDHHWTALGAYYAYEALCETLGMEAAPLDSFEEWDQGTFWGSLYGKVSRPTKLRADNVTAYVPQGDIAMQVYNSSYSTPQEMPILQDMTKRDENEKYLTFLCGDKMMVKITNESLPEGTSCVVIKDSYGNCFVPFLTQNYHTVYAIDYRKYHEMGLSRFVEEYGVQDIIFAPYLIATQSVGGNDMFENRCK